jgi:dihydroorotate dehydrogenase electron transfer subunit
MEPTFRILPVLENKKLGPYNKITLKDVQMYDHAECGNFVMIGLQGFDPYLSRPFSFLEGNRTSFSILLKVKGRGTELLSKVKKGDKLKVLGPLGKIFCPPKKGILIAGGIGIAPVYYQSRWMKGGILFYGAKRKKDMILTREFKDKGFTVRTITEEDGGLVTDLLKEYTDELNDKQIFICGTKGMIKSIKGILNKEQIEKAYVYVEERMGCGLGGCKSCAVKTFEGYRLVCTEGPIFPLKEVKFD